MDKKNKDEDRLAISSRLNSSQKRREYHNSTNDNQINNYFKWFGSCKQLNNTSEPHED